MKIERRQACPGGQTLRGSQWGGRLTLARVDRRSFRTTSILLAGTCLGILLWVGASVGAFATNSESGAGKSAVRSFQVFLFAGQSNMAGADAIVPDPPGFVQQEADRVSLFTYGPGPGKEETPGYHPWGDIRGHPWSRGDAAPRIIHGPEVGFARRLHEAGVSDIAIIKVAGNIPLKEPGWLWSPGKSFFQDWTRFVDDRLAEIRRPGHRYTVAGFVWHQGIDDGLNPPRARSYGENLRKLIAALRHRYGSPRAPFILARSVYSQIAVKRTGDGPASPMALVRAAQVAVAEEGPYAAWIDVDDQEKVRIHHFTSPGQLVLGRRFADAYLGMARTPTASD